MTDDYVPLTDEQVEEIVLRDEVAFRMHSTRVTQSEMDRAALLADRDYWKRRAEAAERGRCHWCGGDKMLAMPCKNGCDDR